MSRTRRTLSLGKRNTMPCGHAVSVSRRIALIPEESTNTSSSMSGATSLVGSTAEAALLSKFIRSGHVQLAADHKTAVCRAHPDGHAPVGNQPETT